MFYVLYSCNNICIWAGLQGRDSQLLFLSYVLGPMFSVLCSLYYALYSCGNICIWAGLQGRDSQLLFLSYVLCSLFSLLCSAFMWQYLSMSRIAGKGFSAFVLVRGLSWKGSSGTIRYLLSQGTFSNKQQSIYCTIYNFNDVVSRDLWTQIFYYLVPTVTLFNG